MESGRKTRKNHGFRKENKEKYGFRKEKENNGFKKEN